MKVKLSLRREEKRSRRCEMQYSVVVFDRFWCQPQFREWALDLFRSAMSDIEGKETVLCNRTAGGAGMGRLEGALETGAEAKPVV